MKCTYTLYYLCKNMIEQTNFGESEERLGNTFISKSYIIDLNIKIKAIRNSKTKIYL